MHQPAAAGGDRRTAVARAVLVPVATIGVALAAAGAAHAAEGRVFEQVTPAAKPNGGQAATRFADAVESSWAAADGDGVLYTPAALGVVPDAARGGATASLARRRPTGWVNTDAFPPAVPSVTWTAVYGGPFRMLPSEDLTSVIFGADVPYSPEQPVPASQDGEGSAALLRGHAGRNDWLTKPTWAGSTPAPGALFGNTANFVPLGGSPDQTTSYFASRPALAADDGAARPQAGTGTDWTVYSSDRDGRPVPAAVLPDGSLDPGGAVPAGISMAVSAVVQDAVVGGATHPVSRAGDSLLFVSPDPASDAADARPPQLYLARRGRPTVALTSGPDGVRRFDSGQALPPDRALRHGIFAFATPDHRYVFFSTNDALTDDAAAPGTPDRKTYRYDSASGDVRYLPQLSVGPRDTVRIVRISDDGSRVLYVVTRENSGSELRLWAGGQVEDLGAGEATNARFSSDGRTLVFQAPAPIKDEPLHPVGTTQLYRLEDGKALTCVSCGTASQPATAQTFLDPVNTPSKYRSARESRAISEDATHVFFQTASALSPDDHNDAIDVYEWTAGGTRLVSGGHAGAHNAFIIDNDLTGRNVFIATDDRLAATDIDRSYDVYDARVGGGLETAPPTVRCEGDVCQAPPAPPREAPRPASTATGPETRGPVAPTTPPPSALRVIRATATTSRVTLRVRVPATGRLVVSGSGVTSVRRKVAGPRTYTMRARLTAAARATLRKRGRLTVAARVRFAPTVGPSITKTATLTIKRAKR